MMFRSSATQPHSAEYHELSSPPTLWHSATAYGNASTYHAQPEELDMSDAGWVPEPTHAYKSFPTALSHVPNLTIPPLGKPAAKKRLLPSDVLIASLSIVSAVLAVVCVVNDSVSWYLGIANRQLAVLGFLLSVMSLCLASIYPRLFLLLEARFGRSALQNYDGIIRNAPFYGGKLDLVWRLALVLMLVFPLGLSVAYKQFSGGYSARAVNPSEYIGNMSYYGMYAPPGLMKLGYQLGINVFSNATIPFEVATSTTDGIEPPLPRLPQAYGFNILLLSNTSAAILDLPQSSYINSVQDLLASDESWNITADVLGTVATFDASAWTEQQANASYFINFCADALASSGVFAHISLMNGWCIVLVDRPQPGNASEQYIALAPDPGLDHQPSCYDIANYSRPFYVVRQACTATWSLSRDTITLLEGHCLSAILPPEQQLVISDTVFWLPVTFMSSLAEMLGSFSDSRNTSMWKIPYMATATATMVWSKIAAQGASNTRGIFHTKGWNNVTFEQAKLFYSTDDKVMYIRPVARKAMSLYIVIIVQPLVLLAMLMTIISLHTTPIDKGFGLTSILAGVDSDSLKPLRGSALSGELSQSVRLNIEPSNDDDQRRIQYRITAMTQPELRKRLRPELSYH